MTSRSPRRIRAAVAIVAAGSLLGLAWNLAAPKGLFSLTAHPAQAQAPAPTPASAPAASRASGTGGTAAEVALAVAPGRAGGEAAEAEAAAAPGPGSAAPDTSPPPPRHPSKKHSKAHAAPAARGTATAHSPKAAAKPKVKETAAADKPATATAAAGAASTPAPAAQAPPRKPAAPVVIELSEARLAHLAHNAIFVDAREASVFSLGHIPGALSLPEGDFEAAFARLEKSLPKDGRIVVYCEGEDCDQAETVSWDLIRKGYTNILYFKKGWDAWEAANYPEEKGPSR